MRDRRILVVQVNWIGDVLFTTPFLAAVRDAYPGAHIACLVHPRCVPMLASNPRVNELIEYGEEGVHRGLIGKVRLAAALRAKRFDTAYILHRSFTKALLAWLAGIPVRVGFATKRRGPLLTVPVPEPEGPLHKVEYFLALARASGIAPRARSYEFIVTDTDRAFARAFLAGSGVGDAGKFIVINPGGNWDPKRWPRARYAALADRLAERFGVAVVITGAEKDLPLARDIEALMRARPVIAAGATTLGQLAALLARSSLVVANDSGPMHLAVAVGAKVIALFGPTSPALTGPYGDGMYAVIAKPAACAVPCYDTSCRDYACMGAITVDDVMREAQKMMG